MCQEYILITLVLFSGQQDEEAAIGVTLGFIYNFGDKDFYINDLNKLIED